MNAQPVGSVKRTSNAASSPTGDGLNAKRESHAGGAGASIETTPLSTRTPVSIAAIASRSELASLGAESREAESTATRSARVTSGRSVTTGSAHDATSDANETRGQRSRVITE
jgi:hypothetical protein